MREDIIRKLARSYKYQFLYARIKEIGGIKLFENSNDFSKVQESFLQWLEIYHSLYSDLSMGEEFLTEQVIEDDLRAEAYLLYRRKNRDKKNGKNTGTIKRVNNMEGVPSVIFKRK